MSYLELPRLCFSGTFKAAPSTINNIPENYQTSVAVPAADQLWNPRGLAEFQLLQGSEITIPPGANVEPTKIRSLQTSAGFITSGDIIGQYVISTNVPSTAKLVDLDPDQQFVSEVWGMQIAIGMPGGEQVVGDYTAAYFQQIFWSRRVPGGPPSAAYQSLLTNLQWPKTITSPFLQQLYAASPDVLSIRFTLDQISTRPFTVDGQPNPGFTLGRVVGVIGPAAAGDPAFLNPRGRMLRPTPAPPAPAAAAAAVASVASVSAKRTARPSIDAIRASAALAAAMKSQPEGPPPAAPAAKIATIAAAPAAPGFSGFNFAPAIFDAPRNTVVLDLSNALQFAGSDPVAGGALTAAIATSGGLIPLGAIDNSIDNYLQRAFVFEFPLTSSSAIAAAQSNPIVVQLNGETVMAENDTGAYVDATGHVVRLDANGVATLSLFATIFGGPVGSGQKVTLGPAAPMKTAGPADPIVTITPSTVALDPGGSGTFTISPGNPGNPRQFIDGQVFGIPIDWSLDTNPDSANAFVSLLVFDVLADDSPTWANVAPIFQQFMHLYPGMQSILNLADEATVGANAKKIAGYLSAPVTSSRYMPVTRDLSGVKKQMILKYLNSL
ncbi:MAG: hypothetical protein QOH21_861 [Acidobacteriota bacterium]|jgi:hypothetical protein|nr:hypothetical protein [Acidobacteriota bacterium]